MTLLAKRDELIARLAATRDPQQRFAGLVEAARRRPPLAGEQKTDDFKVRGCLAQVWLVPEFRAGRCHFHCDSDSQIVKAIAGLLCDFYSGHAPAEILTVEPSFLAPLGITQHLTQNRRNALARVWEEIRRFAENQPPRP